MKKFLSTMLLLSSVLLLGACKGNTATVKENKATVTSTPKKDTKDEASVTETSKNTDKGDASVNETKKGDDKKSGDSSLLKNHKLYGKLADREGADTAKVVEEKDYKVNWSDNSWSGLKIGIDNVSVLKVSDYKDYEGKESAGFIILHFVADNTQRDLRVHPGQAKMNTNTGEQVEGSTYGLEDAFSDELMKGTKVESYVAYPLKKIDKIADINKLRLKFSGMYMTDDYKDQNALHDYDITIELKEPAVI